MQNWRRCNPRHRVISPPISRFAGDHSPSTRLRVTHCRPPRRPRFNREPTTATLTPSRIRPNAVKDYSRNRGHVAPRRPALFRSLYCGRRKSIGLGERVATGGGRRRVWPRAAVLFSAKAGCDCDCEAALESMRPV
ncbi:hypothetical protein H6P81_020144 [Aristolochia fimbriata]|uniref:Uncharacterized protein n=1 Tax=Aristolochia fimbriata TaxID=158543 RepID=A0AAV7DUQ7_ARIFI|nr:hypothetical protein H6P81_020144 [Aristolochia fimbriata]